MQSIYWVLSWACHRKCRHCYDDRFRPYVRSDLAAVVDEGRSSFRRIIANLPDDFSYVDPASDHPDRKRRSLLVLAGGELLIDPVREALFYPALVALAEKYGDAGPTIGVQTTGDVMTERHVVEMIARGVETIAIASIDDHHVGMEGERKFAFMEGIREMMARLGVRETSLGGERDDRLIAPDLNRNHDASRGPNFLFFGAQPDLWIGELWPRGRAFSNGLSNATYATNFCARWSGGKNFLKYGLAGSEVAVEPDGSVYPCCLKTKAPLGSLAEEPLRDILESVATLPAIQAIDRGDPEAMGIHGGWSRETFARRSEAVDGAGRAIANMCLGCDAWFAERLGAELAALRSARLARRDRMMSSLSFSG